MKKELLFYNQIEFESIRTLFQSLEYEVISLSYFLEDLKDLDKFTPYKSGICVIDVSILGGGYYNTSAIQAIGENVFRLFNNEDIIYICDNKYFDQLKYELRYCFEQFVDIKEKYDIFFEQLPPPIIATDKIHKKITDFTPEEFETFFKSFRESLYGHEKFKDDFYEIAKSFRLFNKIGEHKVLSLFLLGESGVGKTEVARALYKCLGGKDNLAKVNFGNYSNEFSLSSLIGSARGYIGSDDGEIFIRVRNTDVGLILIDEFEKSKDIKIDKPNYKEGDSVVLKKNMLLHGLRDIKKVDFIWIIISIVFGIVFSIVSNDVISIGEKAYWFSINIIIKYLNCILASTK